MRKSLIDTLDIFSRSDDGRARWDAAVDLAGAFGIKSLVVAHARGTTGEIGWLNTNMSDCWMEQYIHEDYMKVDALLKGLATQHTSTHWDTGRMKRDEAPSRKLWEMDHGLRDHGYGYLSSSRYCEPDRFGTYVTLGFEDKTESRVGDPDLDLSLFSALLATNIDAPLASPANRVLTGSTLRLTTRQQDVLCLLAAGFQTARIAEKLGLSEPTVSFHLAKAREALGAQTREHALALALKYRLISP